MPLSDHPPAVSWVESGSEPNEGLDLTGLRLPVLTIGNYLLDGVTTVTPSVRYFSFYVWILSSYVHSRGLNSWKDFQLFADKVESAIALGNRLNHVGSGIVGARGASRLLATGDNPVPLRSLVKQPATNIYFNPALQLKLLLQGPEVPGLSKERGEPLAEIVRSAFSKTALGNEFSAAKQLSKAELEDLRAFGEVASLTKIAMDEAKLLTASIIPLEPRSDREARRVQTYACLLGLAQALSHPPSEEEFFEEATHVHRLLPQQFHNQMNGWLRHLVRDCIAVGHEYLLQEIIHALEDLSMGRRSIAGRDVVARLLDDANAANQALAEYGLLRSGEDARSISFKKLFDRIKAATKRERFIEDGLCRWGGKLTEVKLIRSIRETPAKALSLLPAIWCIAMLRAEEWPEPESNSFEGRNGIGWNAIGVHEVIGPGVRRFLGEEWTLGAVMGELALRTVDQHLRVSWSRLAGDSRHDVALLIADGEQWRSRLEKHVKDFRAGRTASRIYQAVNWLWQLGLIGEGGLTQRGKVLYRLVTEQARKGANEA